MTSESPSSINYHPHQLILQQPTNMYQRSLRSGYYSPSYNLPLSTWNTESNLSTTREGNATAKKSQVIKVHSSSQWKMHFEASKHGNKLMVIDFSASWCGPCQHIEPVLDGLAAKYTNVEFIKIDVDELHGVAEEFRVQTMPTIILIKNGKQVDKVVGAKKEELFNKIEIYRL